MLLKIANVRGIVSGGIDRVFRVWKRPAARAGGRQRTPLGELRITSVEACARADLDAADATRAGFSTPEELLESLRGRRGTLYRIRLGFAGEDPPPLLISSAWSALFKRWVRSLKELGLTERLAIGYRLSPRGLAVIAALRTSGR